MNRTDLNYPKHGWDSCSKSKPPGGNVAPGPLGLEVYFPIPEAFWISSALYCCPVAKPIEFA